MPIFEVKNFTRYNTEDIIRQLAVIEGYLQGEGGAQRGRVQTYGNRGPLISPIVTIRDYNPSSPWAVQPGYCRRPQDLPPPVRNYVKKHPNWKRVTECRIVRPVKLYLSPTEALAAAGEDATLPSVAQEQLCWWLLWLYALPPGFGYSYRTSPPPHGGAVVASLQQACGPIRIEGKRQGVLGKAEKARAAHERAKKAWASASASTYQLDHYHKKLVKDHNRALAALKRSKAPLNEEELLLVARLETFEESLSELKQQFTQVLGYEAFEKE